MSAVACPPHSIARSYSSMIHPMAGGMAPVLTSASSGRNHEYASRASMRLGIIRTNADYGQIRKLVSLTQSAMGPSSSMTLNYCGRYRHARQNLLPREPTPFLRLQYQYARQAFDCKLVSVVCLRDIRAMMQQGPFWNCLIWFGRCPQEPPVPNLPLLRSLPGILEAGTGRQRYPHTPQLQNPGTSWQPWTSSDARLPTCRQVPELSSRLRLHRLHKRTHINGPVPSHGLTLEPVQGGTFVFDGIHRPHLPWKLVVEDFKVHGRQIPLVAFRVPSSDSTKNLAPLPPFTSHVLEKLGIQDRHSKGLSRGALLALQPHQPTRLTCSSRRWCDKPCRAIGHPSVTCN